MRIAFMGTPDFAVAALDEPALESLVGMRKNGQHLLYGIGYTNALLSYLESGSIRRLIVEDDYAIFVPAGKWHNIVNKGDKPLKLYSIYAPAEHPHGTVHKTQQEAMEAEHAH